MLANQADGTQRSWPRPNQIGYRSAAMRHAICAVLVAAFMAPVTAAELTMLATAAAQGPIQALEKAYRDVRIEGARRRARRHPGHHDIRGAAGVYVGRLGILKRFHR
jgi:hypothetical protein